MKLLSSTALGTFASTLGVLIFTFISEIEPPFSEFLASLSGSVWISKSVIAVIIFAIVFLIGILTPRSLSVVRCTYLVLIGTSSVTFLLTMFSIFHSR